MSILETKLPHIGLDTINANSLKMDWGQIKDLVRQVCKFGNEQDMPHELLVENDPNFSHETLEKFYNQPGSVLLFLVENGEVIGLAFAVDITESNLIPKEEFPTNALPIIKDIKTAYVYFIVIKPDKRFNMLRLKRLQSDLENQVWKSEFGYKQIAVHATGAAVTALVRFAQKGNIVYDEQTETKYGKQTFIIYRKKD
jgi:predicted acetyltransferase